MGPGTIKQARPFLFVVGMKSVEMCAVVSKRGFFFSFSQAHGRRE